MVDQKKRDPGEIQHVKFIQTTRQEFTIHLYTSTEKQSKHK